MYLIYYQTVGEKTIHVKDFAYTPEEATEKLIKIAKDFIIVEEGTKKAESTFKDEPVDLSKIVDGLYLIKIDNIINVYKKTTNIKLVSGWISSTQEPEYKSEYLGCYVMQEFQTELLDFHKRSAFESRQIKLKDSITHDNVRDELIKAMSDLGFKPQKGTKFSIKKKVVNENQIITALDLSIPVPPPVPYWFTK